MAEGWLALAGMTAGTYATRAWGYWLIGRVTISPRLRRALDALPGGILIGVVAPNVVGGGPAEWIAAALTLATARRTKNLLAAMTAGVIAVAILRRLFPL